MSSRKSGGFQTTHLWDFCRQFQLCYYLDIYQSIVGDFPIHRGHMKTACLRFRSTEHYSTKLYIFLVDNMHFYILQKTIPRSPTFDKLHQRPVCPISRCKSIPTCCCSKLVQSLLSLNVLAGVELKGKIKGPLLFFTSILTF